MAFISAFEVLGPCMIGPSSSHTAGAAKIAYLAQKMISDEISSVEFTLYGSFAETYKGHGTDKALLGGMLGFAQDDIRIRDSFDIARERGLSFNFIPNTEEKDVHPNTVDIHMLSPTHDLTVRGESLGGGKVHITRINQVEVDFSGEYGTVIVVHQDRPGLIAHISRCLCDRNVNIAFMRLYREAKGSIAYSIVESDGLLPSGIADDLYKNQYVHDVMILQA